VATEYIRRVCGYGLVFWYGTRSDGSVTFAVINYSLTSVVIIVNKITYVNTTQEHCLIYVLFSVTSLWT